MYYHFYIKYYDTNGKLKSAYVENETDLEKIKEQYVNPFKDGKPMIIVSGSVVRLNKVESFRVLKSEKTLDEIYKEFTSSAPRGIIVVVSKTDLLSEHNKQLIDITNELI